MTTVILAEPEAPARWVRTREFEAAGFTVLPAADEAELDVALAQPGPEALVVDRRLVGPTGERLRRLRQDPRRRDTGCYVLVLVPTGPDRQTLLEAGADWYIDKTALVSSLARAVRAQIHSVRPPAGRRPRLAPRTRVALPIEYSPRGSVGSGETRDLSPAGLFVVTANPAAVGEMVLLGFTVQGARRWECFGRVLWNRRAGDAQPFPAGMGLEFVDLQPEATAALAISSS